MTQTLQTLMDIETQEQEDAVGMVCKLYTDKMLHVAHSILRNRYDAEEALMDVYYNFCKKPEPLMNYRSKQTISYIIQCTKNSAIDVYRKNKRNWAEFVPVDTTECNWESIYNVCEDFLNIEVNERNAELLSRAIDKLKPLYRNLVILKYYHGFRNYELARMRNVPEDKISSQLHQARELLKKDLEKMGYRR